MSEKSYQSFGEQALHYFRRDHEEIRREPITGPAAWRGEDLLDDPSWRITLGAAHLEELHAAVRGVRARGLTLGEVHREDFPLPGLDPLIDGWRRELTEGRGFLLLRGIPVEAWGDDDAALAYWGLGLHLGRPGAQNPAEELLGHVRDTGEEATNPNIRRYRTSGDIAYHCDLADVVGLLCLRTARAGGASRIVSSVSVYNELLARRPDLIDRLYEPFSLDGRDEGKDGKARVIPVPPCRFAAGRLRTFYHSDYFRSVVRHANVPPFTEEEQTLLDLYEEIASSPELRLDMQFEPGDIQLLSNHVVLHARSAYEDEPGPGRERHLLRLWLSLEEDSMAKDEPRDERPAVWLGHVTMATDQLVESNEFMVALGLRPIVLTESVAVLELRGGTHLVLLPTENPPKGRAPFDLMVEDLDATHQELAAKGLAPSAVESGKIHSSFTVTDPSGQQVLFNSSHVGDLPV